MLLYLPQEILQQIISHVPDGDLCALELVSQKLHRLANDPLLWRHRCRRFKYWEGKVGGRNCGAHPTGHYQILGNWKRVFHRRLQVEVRTTKLLNNIIVNSSQRIQNTEMIANYGFDAKDVLLQQVATPETSVDWMARRFHASTTLAYIHRQRAIEYWAQLTTSPTLSLEKAICCFDLFVLDNFEHDSEEVSKMLFNISKDIVSTYRDFPDLTVKQKATSIIRYIRSLGFLGCLHENFQDLANSFMGQSMRAEKSTLPIISCSIFCSVARRLGLDASPCAYPYHVYVLVRENESSHFYVDPHEGPDLVFQSELESRLHEMGIVVTPESIIQFLRPASIKELVLRNARNILRNTPLARRNLQSNQSRKLFDINIDSAEYAALFAIALLSSTWTIRILEPLCRCLQESFIFDVGLVEKYIIPLASTESRPARLLKTICVALRNEDGMIRKEKRRSSPENRSVLFRIGTVFQHKRYGYQAVITGWTTHMTYENVHAEEAELQKGLTQPFYRALVEDASDRYVAQENIIAQHPQTTGRLNSLSAGKYFKRFDQLEGRFISNMREEYPED